MLFLLEWIVNSSPYSPHVLECAVSLLLLRTRILRSHGFATKAVPILSGHPHYFSQLGDGSESVSTSEGAILGYFNLYQTE